MTTQSKNSNPLVHKLISGIVDSTCERLYDKVAAALPVSERDEVKQIVKKLLDRLDA